MFEYLKQLFEKMKHIIKPGIWKIIKLFYDNHNSQLYLREISRKVGMNESSVSRHLNELTKHKILIANLDGNLKKFKIAVKFLPKLFSLYDQEKLMNLPSIRRNAMQYYLKKTINKPLLAVVFGSTAKGTFKEESDLDILLVSSSKIDNSQAIKYAQAQTGIKIQEFQVDEKTFYKEIKSKNDKVLQSAIQTGFPIFNCEYFYEVIYNE